MSLQLVVVTILAATSLSFGLLFLVTIARTVAARRELVRRAGSLKIADGFSIWAGHANSYLFAEGVLYKIGKLHERLQAKTVGFLYGFRRAVVSIDLDLIKRVVVDNQETDRIPMSLPLKEYEFDNIMSANGEQWRRIRRAFAPALKSNKFKTPNVQREIENSINKLMGAIDSKLDEAKQGEIELNIDDYVQRYSLDLVLSCFYKQDNLVDFHSKVEPMTSIIDSGNEAFMWNPVIRLGVIFPPLRSIIDWLIMNFTVQGPWRRLIMDFVRRQMRLNFEARKHVEELRKSGEQLNDEDNFLLEGGAKFSRNMVDHIIDQFHAGKLSWAEYLHSTFFLMGAGNRTPSDSITFTIYQLATHLDVQEKLRQSIREDDYESEYLTWVISESLRLFPSAPIGCSRMTSRDYKCERGVIVPADTFVVTPAYTIHRLEEYWGQDAEEFRPERFADADKFHPMQYIPFGGGARACPGKEFALHQMKKLLCALLTSYKFECEPVEVTYNSPWLVFMIPSRHVHVRVSRV